jgi:thioesterase domain-containing protein
VPIGRPIDNTQLYVLDQHRQPVPIGIAGELYIGGDGLARGYWNRPELTAERFVADPFSAGPARMYRTGDLVRTLADGNIEFLGRLDHQVKLRGFRIELGEIEAALTRHAQVREALVLLREDVAGDKRLVAYMVARQAGLDTSELRAQLKQQLPEYMLPAAFVVLPALPLTPNGKIDRKALPAPARTDADCPTPAVMPRDAIELHLARIWEDLLQRGSIGVRDNFFELGGHSLLAVQLIDRIERTFNRRLPLDTLWFGGGTIEALAGVLRDHSQAGANPELILMKRGTRRPLFVTHTMGGNLFHYYELAQHLDAEQTVYGLQARGVFGGTGPDRSIEAIAAHCIESMRSVQPRGPYLLAGFSSGGVVAFEIAQQLVAAGVRVALLTLLDTFAPAANASAHWRRELRSQWRNGLRPRALQEFVYFAVLHSLKLDRLRALKNAGEAHRWAHWSYRPKPYRGPIEIFIASESESVGCRDSLGWARWFKGSVCAHRIPGNHGQLVKRPTVALLAARLQARIDAVAEAAWPPLFDERNEDVDTRHGRDKAVDAQPG